MSVAACAPTSRPSTVTQTSARAPLTQDSARSLIPAGFGTLRQDDISVRVQQQGLQVRAIPLDETVIRVLSPDSYRALRDLLASQRDRIEQDKRRFAMTTFSLWYLSFFGVEVGEARFSPMELIISNVGRDFRPLDVIALTPGFGSQRVRQREVQHALYIFDAQLEINQPLTLTYETAKSSEWPSVLERIERERSLVRSRAK